MTESKMTNKSTIDKMTVEKMTVNKMMNGIMCVFKKFKDWLDK